MKLIELPRYTSCYKRYKRVSLKFYILHHVSNYCVLLDCIAYPMMIELKPVEYGTAFTRSKYLGCKIINEM